MRPPHHAGEMILGSSVKLSLAGPSMRPPHHAGEMSKRRTSRLRWPSGFNEAPASRGGNAAWTSLATPQSEASMRPPHHAGEMFSRSASTTPPVRCFNEAPASRGGNGQRVALGQGVDPLQ